MGYGTRSLDLGKMVVLLSCLFNIIFPVMIWVDPVQVILSPYGGGWWNPLQKTAREDLSLAIYPRTWATFLIFQMMVRVNWVFTNETAPELYRCVLLSYMLPFLQYAAESYLFRTLPPFDIPTGLLMVVPWIAALVNYPKYTSIDETASTAASKKTK